MAHLLNAQNIRGVYYTPAGKEVVGVDDVTIQMVDGEVLGLAGESGSGKSTLGSIISLTARPPLIVEHEYPRARIQDREKLKPILKGSIAFTRRIDQAAACMYSLQHEVLASQKIPVQGIGRQAYRS